MYYYILNNIKNGKCFHLRNGFTSLIKDNELILEKRNSVIYNLVNADTNNLVLGRNKYNLQEYNVRTELKYVNEVRVLYIIEKIKFILYITQKGDKKEKFYIILESEEKLSFNRVKQYFGCIYNYSSIRDSKNKKRMIFLID